MSNKSITVNELFYYTELKGVIIINSSRNAERQPKLLCVSVHTHPGVEKHLSQCNQILIVFFSLVLKNIFSFILHINQFSLPHLLPSPPLSHLFFPPSTLPLSSFRMGQALQSLAQIVYSIYSFMFADKSRIHKIFI